MEGKIEDKVATLEGNRMPPITDKQKINKLKQALMAAQEHLEYLNYGDAWERNEKLAIVIAKALDLCKEDT